MHVCLLVTVMLANRVRSMAPSQPHMHAPKGDAFSCATGVIENSNRTSVAPCAGVEGDECAYSCEPGYIRVGRHVCQTYATSGGTPATKVTVINRTFFGGRCDFLCPSSNADCAQVEPAKVPVRFNSTEDGRACLKTTCLAQDTALRNLALGNYEIWRRGRNADTGIYLDHVDPRLPADPTGGNIASPDSTGPGLALECVAAALGFITIEEAQGRVLLTLRALTGRISGFRIPRQDPSGWFPTFVDPNTGKALVNPPGSAVQYSTDSTAFNTVGVLFARTFFKNRDPGSDATREIEALAGELYAAVDYARLFCTNTNGGSRCVQGSLTPTRAVRTGVAPVECLSVLLAHSTRQNTTHDTTQRTTK
jgi:hypothetical protein